MCAEQIGDAVLASDAAFCDDSNAATRDHGSTCVFAVVTPQENGEYKMTVSNVGDSRVLIVRADGTLVCR
jgi:serine/threonine protein phosphatase PrpC